MFDIHELDHEWYFYLSLEKDLENTARFVDPIGQDQVYSAEFAKIILLGCTQIESCFKKICEKIAPNDPRGNIGEYKSIILRRFPMIRTAFVFVPRWGGSSLIPFSDWDHNKLFWWEAYTKLKHDYAESFREATFLNAAATLAALYLLILYLQQIFGINGAYCSEYFHCCYSPSPIFRRNEVKLPDFDL